ncbi:MAG TPA: PEP-CTERM sorting domain-containing protein [Bryobacteraceae bacterium]
MSLLIFDYDPTTSVTMAIVPVLPDGTPDTTGTPLASVTEALPPGEGFYTFDFSSQNFNVTKGQQIAFWLTSAGFSRYHNDGFPPSPYTGGDAFYRLPGATDGQPVDWAPINIGGSDDYFVTTVDNPEPATVAIFASGLIALGLLRRRRA